MSPDHPMPAMIARLSSMATARGRRRPEVLAETLDTLLAAEWDLILTTLSHRLGETESPIEELFAMGLMAETWSMPDHYKVESQVEIDTFRVDFLIGYRDAPIGTTYSRVVVECDGHDYHERTREQAKRDKSRDRKLSSLGYTVIRFTGSEIWADPLACAKEACDLASTLFYERPISMNSSDEEKD